MLNQVKLFGYLELPPWEGYTIDGAYYIVICLRTSIRLSSGPNEGDSVVNHLRLKAFGDIARRFVKDAKKDGGVYISGHLQSYAVKGRKGDTKYFPMVVVDDFVFKKKRTSDKPRGKWHGIALSEELEV